MAATCPVCYVALPPRNAVECPAVGCRFRTCRECVRHYVLLSVDTAHCMQCKRPYTVEELAAITNKTFVAKTYADHRKEMLLSMERSLLPATQEVMEKVWGDGDLGDDLDKVERDVRARSEGLRARIAELDRQRGELVKALSAESALMDRLELAKGRRDHTVLVKSVGALREWTEGRGALVANPETKEERRSFVWKCPSPGCRGFLSQKWKCGLCRAQVCNRCGALRGGDDHACSEEEVKTMECLRATTRNCPHCGTGISRIDGCAQMWCTHCHGAFSWTTGEKLDTSKIHNPHYADWKAHNAGTAVRDVGDEACQGVPALTLSAPAAQRLGEKDTAFLCHFVDRLRHHEDFTAAKLAAPYEDKKKMLRLRFLNREITEQVWMRELLKYTKRGEYRDRALQVVNMLVNAGADLLRNFIAAQGDAATPLRPGAADDLGRAVAEMKKLAEYADGQLSGLARAYGYRSALTVFPNGPFCAGAPC